MKESQKKQSQKEESRKKQSQKRYPKGHFIGLGMALFSAVGVPLWVATDNPGMIGAGVAIGVAVGAAWEKKYNKNPRELTPEEARRQKIALLAALLLLVVGVVAGLAVFMMLV
jgi:uncharacterized membrane protein YidH (DUF202 family)